MHDIGQSPATRFLDLPKPRQRYRDGYSYGLGLLGNLEWRYECPEGVMIQHAQRSRPMYGCSGGPEIDPGLTASGHMTIFGYSREG